MKTYMVEIFPAVLAMVMLGLGLLALIVLFETFRWRWQTARAGIGAVGEPEQHGIDEDRQDRRAEDEADARIGGDEGEFADLGEPEGDDQRTSPIQSKQMHEDDSNSRASDEDDSKGGDESDWFAPESTGVELHADRDKDQNREAVAQRQGFFRGPLAQRRLAEDQPGEESAERDRDAKQRRRRERDPNGDRKNRKRDDAQTTEPAKEESKPRLARKERRAASAEGEEKSPRKRRRNKQ